jgi:hypothetical protein
MDRVVIDPMAAHISTHRHSFIGSLMKGLFLFMVCSFL